MTTVNIGPKTITLWQVENDYNSIPESCYYRITFPYPDTHKILSDESESILMILGLDGIRLLSKELKGLQSNLNPSEQWEIYCMCDGFGPLSPEELEELNEGWDWSHVRDSSQEAIDNASRRIKEILIEKYNSM